LNASPAPVVSTAWTRGAAASTSIAEPTHRLPRSPSLITAFRVERRQKSTALARPRLPAYIAASSSLTKTKSAARSSRLNPARPRSDGSQPKSHDVVVPRERRRSTIDAHFPQCFGENAK
jgi:hypothetical protein